MEFQFIVFPDGESDPLVAFSLIKNIDPSQSHYQSKISAYV